VRGVFFFVSSSLPPRNVAAEEEDIAATAGLEAGGARRLGEGDEEKDAGNGGRPLAAMWRGGVGVDLALVGAFITAAAECLCFDDGGGDLDATTTGKTVAVFRGDGGNAVAAVLRRLLTESRSESSSTSSSEPATMCR
jgi:hypothetical protein